ncbi:hypothetical protein C8Q76DRAFT_791062 [Earliella scabrosa]|nr:hypothetical protein C8Q76DRAFT_791062 [Earliella scabrosa]
MTPPPKSADAPLATSTPKHRASGSPTLARKGTKDSGELATTDSKSTPQSTPKVSHPKRLPEKNTPDAGTPPHGSSVSVPLVTGSPRRGASHSQTSLVSQTSSTSSRTGLGNRERGALITGNSPGGSRIGEFYFENAGAKKVEPGRPSTMVEKMKVEVLKKVYEQGRKEEEKERLKREQEMRGQEMMGAGEGDRMSLRSSSQGGGGGVPKPA